MVKKVFLNEFSDCQEGEEYQNFSGCIAISNHKTTQHYVLFDPLYGQNNVWDIS